MCYYVRTLCGECDVLIEYFVCIEASWKKFQQLLLCANDGPTSSSIFLNFYDLQLQLPIGNAHSVQRRKVASRSAIRGADIGTNDHHATIRIAARPGAVEGRHGRALCKHAGFDGHTGCQCHARSLQMPLSHENRPNIFGLKSVRSYLVCCANNAFTTRLKDWPGCLV